MNLLEKVSEKLNYEVFEGVPYGKVKNYTFNISQINQGLSPMLYYVFTFMRPVSNADLTQIKNLYGRLLNIQTDVIGTACILYIPVRSNLAKHGLEKDLPKLESLVDKFESLGLAPLTSCPFSGNSESLTPRILNHALLFTSDEAYQQYVSHIDQVIKDEKALAKYLPTSILLAIVGAIIGALPSLAIAIAMDSIFALLTALIPIASFVGYKLGRGPKTAISLIIVSAISLIAGATFITIYYQILLMSLDVTWADLFANSEASIGFFKDLGLTLLFTGIGVLISWSYLRRQTVNVLKDGLKK